MSYYDAKKVIQPHTPSLATIPNLTSPFIFLLATTWNQFCFITLEWNLDALYVIHQTPNSNNLHWTRYTSLIDVKTPPFEIEHDAFESLTFSSNMRWWCLFHWYSNVRLFEAKNKVFEFIYQKMNKLKSVQCSKKLCLSLFDE